jgi:hypothetical protein
MRTTWPIVIRLGGDPSRICLELIRPERSPDRAMLKSLVDAHRERGALVALDDLSGGAESLACLEELKPDIGKIDRAMTAGIQHSAARRRLVGRARRGRPRAGLPRRRRGHRARRRVPGDGRPRRRPRAGLLLRQPTEQPDGGRHPPRAPPPPSSS